MAEERIERRLAAILAADLVGYSRLMRADEAGTLERLIAIRRELLDPKIAEYGGRIVKTTGDGVLVEFVSAVDAVQHAIDVQQMMAKRNASTPASRHMHFRMGINVGDVIVQDNDLFGDGVNVAARLEGMAEPGGICISGNAYEQVRDKLNARFEDLGEQQVKNIDRAVHVFRVILKIEDSGKLSSTEHNATSFQLHDKPSIAVLPFNNMSGDPEQDYFADGLAEDLITALSRFHSFFIIARNSSFKYKGAAVDVVQVSRELCVQYVIEGSVRRSGDRVRISAQLIDAATRRHVWAERYDRSLNDIFDLQDEITTAISGAVGPSFAIAEALRASRKAPENLGAWDLAMRAYGHVWKTNKSDLKEAKRLFREAIDIDPNSSYALSGLAMAYVREAGAGIADNFRENLDAAQKAAQRSIELDNQDACAHLAFAWVLHLNRENDLAQAACLKALEVNPNLADAKGFLALVCAQLGKYDASLFHLENAIRLSPKDPTMPFWILSSVIAALVADRPEKYLEHATALNESEPNFIPGIRHFVAANANLDRMDEAKSAVEKALALVPNDRITSILASIPIADSGARERFIAGLRKAGYPP